MRRTVVLLAAALLTAPLLAQSSAEANAGLEFNFGSPGARSLGLGGAFVAMADDATAVFVNPAGLTRLAKTEVAVEGRTFSFTNSFTAGGRASGQPSMNGIDTVSGLIEGQQRENVTALSFASFVYPGGRWSAALYRHELANFRLSTRAEGVLLPTTQLGRPTTVRTFPSTNTLELEIVSYGASFAHRIGRRLSLGATVAAHQFTLDSITSRYNYTAVTEPAEYRSVARVEEQHGRTTELGVHAGMLWQATDDLTVGVSYQRGNDFDVDVSSHPPGVEAMRETGGFFVPEVLRAGAAYTFRGYTTVSFQVDRIRYSQITGRLVTLHGEENHYRADDGTEFHLGVQQFLVNEWLLNKIRYPLVISVGIWRDPDHRIRYSDPAVSATLLSTSQSVLFRRGEDEYHYSIGAALAAGESYEFGVAYDRSPRQQTASASLIVRF